MPEAWCPHAAPRRRLALPPLPREHGAYAQLAAPLVTTLFVAGASASSIALAIACLVAFLAHESLLVVLGVRGPRAKREAGTRARTWLLGLVAVAAGSGVTALATGPADLAPWLLWPLVPAIAVLTAAARGLEKRWPVEVLVALAFAAAALPLARAAGADARLAWSVAAPFAVVFVASTIAVRGVLLHGRPTVSPASAAIARLGAATLAAAGVAALAWAARRGLLPWSSALAAAPGTLVVLGLAVRPPSLRHLHAIGYTLGAATLMAALVLMLA